MNTRFFSLISLAAVVLLVVSPPLLADAPDPRIRVSGQAEVSIAPDMALLQLIPSICIELDLKVV